MTSTRHVCWTRSLFAMVIVILLSLALIKGLPGEPEIALVIGEPYEAMRQRGA